MRAWNASLDQVEHRPWPLARGPWRWRQGWRDLMFAHWPVPVAALRGLVPPSISIQEFDGTSWVGVVPFHMEGVMARPLPDMPGISAFHETNLRLYVEVGGKPGVWFVSLDAANRLAVVAARRLFHLPYFHADMWVRREGHHVYYSSVRRGEGARVAFGGVCAPSSAVFEARPGTLEHFLTERYCLYAQTRKGNIVRAHIHHAPWQLQTALAEVFENTIGETQGIELRGPPALTHFSRTNDVVVWPLERV